jgi:O-antigen/teichoic acid export membrane protein
LLNSLLALVFDRSSTFLIGALLNPVSVAAFEVALKIPDGFMRLFNSFIIVYFPTLSNLFAKGNRDDAHKMMNSSLILLSTGINFLVLVSFLFADKIVRCYFQKILGSLTGFALLMLSFVYVPSLISGILTCSRWVFFSSGQSQHCAVS